MLIKDDSVFQRRLQFHTPTHDKRVVTSSSTSCIEELASPVLSASSLRRVYGKSRRGVVTGDQRSADEGGWSGGEDVGSLMVDEDDDVPVRRSIFVDDEVGVDDDAEEVVAVVAGGEDASVVISRSRGFCFTLNSYTDAGEELVKALKVKYLVYGREVAPGTGMKHLQGYVYFSNLRSFKAVKKLFLPFKPHIEVAKGNALQNEEYCKKGGDFFEIGVRPKTAKEKGVGEKQRWAVALQAAKENRLDDIDPDIRMRCYNTCKSVAADYMKLPEDIDGKTCVWIYGDSGVGKSRMAHFKYKPFYHKMMNKWWNGYKGEDNVLLEDIDPDHEKFMRHFLKIWIDRYAFTCEAKNTIMMIRPKMIVITSQYHPHEVFGDKKTRIAICRRMEIIHLSEPWAPEGEEVGAMPEYIPFCPERESDIGASRSRVHID